MGSQMRSSLFSIVVAACGLLLGCQGESVTTGTTPAIQSATLDQLSAGGGIAGYDFYIDIGGISTRVGSLLVTNGAYDVAQGYYDETEYWRWEAGALAAIETGGVSDIDVDFVGTSETYDATLVGNFESGTETWTAWQVNRNFQLNKSQALVWNDPPNQVLYRLEADAWGGEPGSITYYHLMDFSDGYGYPVMSWYIARDDYARWVASEGRDEDSDGIWEVRLTDDTVFEQTPFGLGYELQTVK